ncbi:MAG: hypothetical protein ACERKO_10960 [Acetanaerobacterium sp.]
MMVAIDAGSSMIKIIEGEPRRNGVRVVRAVMTETPAGAVRDGNLLATEEVASVIRLALSRARIKSRAVTFTVGSTEILHRELSVPRVDAKRLAPIVQNEMYQHLTGGEGYTVDYLLSSKPVPDSPGLQLVNASGMPKTMAAEYLVLTNMLRMKPGSLQIHPSATAKLLAGAAANDIPLNDKSYILCDIGGQTMFIYLYEGADLLFTRCVKTPCEDFFQAMLRLDGFDKRAQVHEGVDLSPEALAIDARVAQASSALLQFLSEELQRMLQFSLSRNLQSPVQTVLLCGGTSTLRGLDTYLGSALDLPVQRLGALSGVTSPPDADIALYINAIGAIARR